MAALSDKAEQTLDGRTAEILASVELYDAQTAPVELHLAGPRCGHNVREANDAAWRNLGGRWRRYLLRKGPPRRNASVPPRRVIRVSGPVRRGLRCRRRTVRRHGPPERLSADDDPDPLGGRAAA